MCFPLSFFLSASRVSEHIFWREKMLLAYKSCQKCFLLLQREKFSICQMLLPNKTIGNIKYKYKKFQIFYRLWYWKLSNVWSELNAPQKIIVVHSKNVMFLVKESSCDWAIQIFRMYFTCHRRLLVVYVSCSWKEIFK